MGTFVDGSATQERNSDFSCIEKVGVKSLFLDYPKIGGGNIIEDYSEKAIRNLLHANIDVHNIRLIAEFPKDGIKCIE